MRRLSNILFAILIALSFVAGLFVSAAASGIQEQQNQTQNPNQDQTRRVLHVPHRRRRRGRDVRRHRGIGHAYKHAGTSAGRGGKRFGKNIAHGKPLKGGKEFGKGMAGTGKGVGQGTARVGKKVGRKVKHAVTP
jgi:Ni/Co efflux regulator RcnB